MSVYIKMHVCRGQRTTTGGGVPLYPFTLFDEKGSLHWSGTQQMG